MRHRRSPSLLAVAAALALLAGCGGSKGNGPASGGKLPLGFVGMVSEDAFSAQGRDRAAILAAEHGAGVRLVRQVFDWSNIERHRGRFVFDDYDRFVAAAARAGLDVLPVLFQPPSFYKARPVPGADITPTTAFPPRDPRSIAGFATALVKRYGPGGSFWAENPKIPARPIRSWQVWNEPSLPQYWGGRPDARAYAALLGAAHDALHAADPHAEVVTAGIPNSKQGVPLLSYLRELLAADGGRGFDTVAIHPYSANSDAVLLAVQNAGRLLRASHNKARIWVTEIGWASGGPGSDFTVAPERQGQFIFSAVTQLASRAKELGVRGVVYFAWRDARPYRGGKDFWGLHTGLHTLDGAPKPALAYFQKAAGEVAGSGKG